MTGAVRVFQRRYGLQEEERETVGDQERKTVNGVKLSTASKPFHAVDRLTS